MNTSRKINDGEVRREVSSAKRSTLKSRAKKRLASLTSTKQRAGDDRKAVEVAWLGDGGIGEG